MANFVLEVIEGPDAGRKVPLTGPVEVGRGLGTGVALDDPEVSRRHARIEPSPEGAIVSDLGSTNGTFVNDQPAHSERAIGAGDRVRVGLSVLELRGEDQVAAQPSAVRPRPQVTALGQGVLRPARPDQLPAAQDPPKRPPFEVDRGGPYEPQRDPGYAALASLVDTRVKQRTGVAAFALIAAAGLAVGLLFGLR